MRVILGRRKFVTTVGRVDELRERKRTVFLAIAAALDGLTVAGAPVKVRRSADALRFEADLPGGARGLVHLATIKEGLPAGEFAIDPSAFVYGGLVREVLEQLPVPGRHIAGLGAIVAATTPRGRSEATTYAVRAGDHAVIDTVAGVVRDGFVPLLAAFTGDWPVALAHTLAHPSEVDRPYSAATVLALLAGRRTSEVEAHAAARTGFWDRDPALAVPGWLDTVGALVAAAG